MSGLTIRQGAPKRETIIVLTGAGGGGEFRDNRGPKGYGRRPASKEQDAREKCTSITFFFCQSSKIP